MATSTGSIWSRTHAGIKIANSRPVPHTPDAEWLPIAQHPLEWLRAAVAPRFVNHGIRYDCDGFLQLIVGVILTRSTS